MGITRALSRPVWFQQNRSFMMAHISCFVMIGTNLSILFRAEYFFHIAKLNQLLVLSQQLEEDIRHLGSHKYIAHQLSVIYVRPFWTKPFYCLSLHCKWCPFASPFFSPYVCQQVICSFRGIQALSDIKQNIEANFKQMKQCLVADEGSRHEPQLAAHYINWWVTLSTVSCGWLMQQCGHREYSSSCRILEITQSLTSLVLSLPEELTDDIHQAVAFVSQFLSWCHTVYVLNELLGSR